MIGAQEEGDTCGTVPSSICKAGDQREAVPSRAQAKVPQTLRHEVQGYEVSKLLWVITHSEGKDVRTPHPSKLLAALWDTEKLH